MSIIIITDFISRKINKNCATLQLDFNLKWRILLKIQSFALKKVPKRTKLRTVGCLHTECTGDLVISGSNCGLDVEPQRGRSAIVFGSGGGVGVPIGEEGGRGSGEVGLVAAAGAAHEPSLGCLHLGPDRRVELEEWGGRISMNENLERVYY